jgi:hypothetical protein
MSRIKIIAGTGLAALALAALGASAPVASAKGCSNPAECYGVLLSPGVHIPVPEPDPWSIVSETPVEFTVGQLVVNCPQGQLQGQIESAQGHLEGSITSSSFGPGACSSSAGPVLVTVGPAPGVGLTELLKTNGKAQLMGPIDLTLAFEEGGMSCSYSTKSVKGTYNTDGAPIRIEPQKPPKFKVKEDSSPGCAKKGTLSQNAWDVNAAAPAGGEFPVIFVR